LPDDVILPLPCGGAMVLRPVATGASPADAAVLPPDVQRLYRVAGRFDPQRTGIGHLLIGKYEVTRLQYQTVIAAARRSACPRPDAQSALPQVEVNRRDAEGFGLDLSQWLADQQGSLPDCSDGRGPCLPRVDGVAATVRLPGEDEWAFAARGGLAVSAAEFAASVYPMSKGLAPDVIGKGLIGAGLIGKREGGSAAAPIGGPRANPLGLHDMLGNVEEIMLDLYRIDGASGEIGGYVVRGGSFYSEPAELAVTLRREVPLLNKTSDTGFRVVAAVPIYTSGRRLAEVQGPDPAGAGLTYPTPEAANAAVPAQAPSAAPAKAQIPAAVLPESHRERAGAPLVLSADDRREIAIQLVRLGYDPWVPGASWRVEPKQAGGRDNGQPLDKFWDSARRAIAAFQEAAGLEASGDVTAETRAALTAAVAALKARERADAEQRAAQAILEQERQAQRARAYPCDKTQDMQSDACRILLRQIQDQGGLSATGELTEETRALIERRATESSQPRK
jgi:peptidoglycan hydrolase-like protein with peptidoglycan-binding domain